MKKISEMNIKLKRFFGNKENLFLFCFFLFILSILSVNALHESYPDEFDNILGGKYLLQRIPIYTGFFTHHGPLAYFISAFILLFSNGSFVSFRILFAVLIFLFLLCSYLYLRKSFGSKETNFYLGFIFITALAGNYYWLHMLLADSLSAYFFAPVITLLLLATFYKRRLRLRDLAVISILTAGSILSSLTFIYLSILVYSYSLYLYISTNKSIKLFSKRIVPAVSILLAPYIIFLAYLLLTISLNDYLYQGFTFNQLYYVYNYPRPEGSTTINPIRFAIVIANVFYNNYYTLLQQVPSMNLGFPVNIAMAVSTFFLALYLLIKRRFLFALFFIGLLIYSNARSDPLTSKETDYQSAVYIIIAFISAPFLLTKLWEELNYKITETASRYIYLIMFIVAGIYSLSASMFLFQKFFNRTYDKYMGRAALIYDRPQLAPIINKITKADDKVWIGPFEFGELFYTDAKPASRYQIFIPGMGASPEIRKDFINELERSKPKVIYFQKNFFILGRNPEMYGQFFIEYLQSKYVTLYDYRENGNKYVSLVPVSEKVDIETRLYIRKEYKEEIIKRLVDSNFIKQMVIN